MHPDYAAMINDFIKPVVSLFLIALLILGWITAFRLMNEITLLRIKLGMEDEKIREDFKTWILRKSAPIVLSIYDFKSFLLKKQFYPEFKNLFRKKNLKLAFKLGVVASIVSIVLGIDSNKTN